MEIPSCRGRVGTHTREYGLAGRTFRLASASELVSSAASAGAGTIGDSIGAIGTQDLAAAGTTPRAALFITGTITIAEAARAAELLPEATLGIELPPEILADVGELALVPARATLAGAAMFSTVPGQHPGLLTETRRLPEDTLSPAARPASVRAHSAASPRVGRREAFPRAEAPALVAGRCEVVEAEDFAAAVAAGRVAVEVGAGSQSFFGFQLAREI